ncbi:MAG: FKBP-type peptidyl-prolyl cis-trans isomerase [Bacteroidota bacterium]
MNKFILSTAIVALSLTWMSCQESGLKKTKGGMPYQLFTDAKKPKVKMGGFLKLAITQSINDSIVYTSAGKLPNYIPVLNQTAPYDLSELWSELRLGDSVVATQMMDTFINRQNGNIPPPFKKGDRITTKVKVLGIFDNDSLHKIDAQKEFDAFKNKEIKEVETYAKKSDPNVSKTPNGVYVQVLKPGVGNLIDTGKYVSVSYTGKTFDDKVFDSNVDTSFHHTEPLNFTVGAGQMIPGFDEGIRLLRPGGQAIFYIPSLLGYGAGGSGSIKPYAHLKFKVEVLSVQDKAPEAPRAAQDAVPTPTPSPSSKKPSTKGGN